MKEYWNELFKNREKRFPHEPILEEYIEIFQGKKVVELGAGDGRNSLYLADKAKEIAAFDYSEKAIEKIKSKIPNIKINITDIEKEELDLRGYQIVLMVHYFPSFEKFNEIFNSLEKGVVVFIYTFIKEEVDGSRQSVGISYEEIEQLDLFGETIKKEFVDDVRGKSVFMLIRK